MYGLGMTSGPADTWPIQTTIIKESILQCGKQLHLWQCSNINSSSY